MTIPRWQHRFFQGALILLRWLLALVPMRMQVHIARAGEAAQEVLSRSDAVSPQDHRPRRELEKLRLRRRTIEVIAASLAVVKVPRP